MRAAARRLEFDLLRFLRREAERDGDFEPEHLELPFGFGEGSVPVEIEPGLRVSGRIDRVDTSDGMALVIDYKSGKNVDSYKVGSWESENRFQAALYMLVVERLLGLRAAGGVYVPLGSAQAARAAWSPRTSSELGSGFVQATIAWRPRSFARSSPGRSGRCGPPTLACARASSAANPDSCAWNGGCSYPSICRCEA